MDPMKGNDMRKLIASGVMVAALIAPAAATADKPARPETKNAAKNAAKECKELRKAAGEQNFRNMFGGKRNAFGKCVSQHTRRHRQEGAQQAGQQAQAEKNAAKKCKAERKNDPQGFAQRYGTRRNAFGKCVSRNANGSVGQYVQQP
jgi:ribosomal protein L12E/L44/L45/RPP1/RPP2